MTTNTYNLFLDDERQPRDAYKYTANPKHLNEKWTVVKTHEEFVDFVSQAFACGKVPGLVSFDHDLHPEHYEIGARYNFQNFDYKAAKNKTGLACAEWLLKFCLSNDIPFPQYFVHSQNTYGKWTIESTIRKFSEKHKVKAS